MALDMKRIQVENSKAILKPHELVASSIPEWKVKMKEVLQTGVNEIVFDLVDTDIVDSAGIGLFIQTYNSLSKTKGMITIINASATLKDLFRSMQLDKRFNIIL